MRFDEGTIEPVANVSPDALQAFLRARGWVKEGPEGPAGRYFVKPEAGKDAAVLVVTKSTSPRFASATSLLLDRVASVENVSREALRRDLTMAAYDVVRVRLLAADDGAVDLDAAIKVARESRAALIAAANAEASRAPRKNYAGRQHESVGAFADRVMLGQTERGSFVLPLLCPYSYDPSETLSLPGEWFGRRVTRKFVTALGAVDQAIGYADDNDENDPFAEATGEGVSANICAALGRLVEAAGPVEVSIRWALPHPDSEAPKPIIFDESASPVLLRAAARLAAADPPPPEPLLAYVTKLQEPDQAVVEAFVEGRLRKVQLEIPVAFRGTFAKAWEDRHPLVLIGPMRTDGNRLYMDNFEAGMMAAPDETTDNGTPRLR